MKEEDKITEEEQDRVDREEVGANIALIRRKKDITQDELAERIGHHAIANTVSRIENGHTNMRMNTFFNISSALMVTPNDICPRRLIEGTPLEYYRDLNFDSRQMIGDMILVMLKRERRNNTGE